MTGDQTEHDPLDRYIGAAAGLTRLTRSGAESIVKRVLEQGTAVTGNAHALVDDLLERSQENRHALLALIRSETKRVVKAMGLASADDVERLQRQLAALRRRLQEEQAATREGDVDERGPDDVDAATPSSAGEAARRTAAEQTAAGAAGSPEEDA